MRHNPFTGVFNGAYINENVRFNVQDVFVESNILDDGLRHAFTYMSIWYNPSTLDTVPIKLIDQLLGIELDIIKLNY